MTRRSDTASSTPASAGGAGTEPRGGGGRRPGISGTRALILSAAREQFASLGYDKTSLRGIARQAGVDSALILHFFGSKQQLFVVGMDLPFDPATVIPVLLQGERSEIGLRVARFVVSVLSSAQGHATVLGLLRAASSEESVAAQVRQLLTRELFGPMAKGLGSDHGDLRAAMAGTSVVGLAAGRHIVGLPALATAPDEVIVAMLAPTLQRYLVEPLDLSG